MSSFYPNETSWAAHLPDVLPSSVGEAATVEWSCFELACDRDAALERGDTEAAAIALEAVEPKLDANSQWILQQAKAIYVCEKRAQFILMDPYAWWKRGLFVLSLLTVVLRILSCAS